MMNHVLLNLAIGHRALKDYFMASSVEEALAYLMSHHGKAQVVGGGTQILLRVQRGECLASHLVDVSRVGSMRRIALEDGSLSLGGALTLRRILSDERLVARLSLLCEAIELATAPGERILATLAGDVVSAECPALCSLALVALEAKAEITNITGAQWLPVESLFVRPDVSRVDSTSEILTSLRMRAMSRGQGSALAQLPDSAQGKSPLALGLLITLNDDGRKVQWASVAVTAPSRTPVHLIEAEEALVDAIVSEDKVFDDFAERMSRFARQQLGWSGKDNPLLAELDAMARATCQRALRAARASLDSI